MRLHLKSLGPVGWVRYHCIPYINYTSLAPIVIKNAHTIHTYVYIDASVGCIEEPVKPLNPLGYPDKFINSKSLYIIIIIIMRV